MKAITDLWDSLQSCKVPVPLPDTPGMDAAQLIEQATRCVRYYLQNNSLDKVHENTLQQCLHALREVNPGLQGQAQLYFGLLYRLCDVLWQIHQQSRGA